MNINFWNILIFAGIVQGIIFGIIVLTSSYFNSKANKYLALTILTLSLSNLNNWFWDTGLMTSHRIYTIIYLPWQSFFPVVFFIYVSSLIGHSIINNKRKIRYLFLPFVVSTLIFTIIKIDMHLFDKKMFHAGVWEDVFFAIDEYLSLLYSLILGVLAFLFLKKKRDSSQNVKNNEVKVDVDWLLRLFRIGLILCLLWIALFTLSLFLEGKNSWIYYPLWIGLSVLFYWMGYQGLFRFKLAQDRIIVRKLINADNLVLTPRSKTNKKSSGLPLSFNDTRENENFKELERLLEEDHIYRNPNLNQTILSEKIDINVTYLSKLINHVSGMSFSDYITSFRIEEAKLLLTNPKYNHYKIMAIGLECGFTRASFYRIFKEHTGLTPTEYRNKSANL